MPGSEMQYQARWRNHCFQNRILRNYAIVVFDFQRKIGCSKQLNSFVNDFRKVGRIEAMRNVVCHPNLQDTACRIANGPAAVNEVFLDSSNLSDMEVSGNQ